MRVSRGSKDWWRACMPGFIAYTTHVCPHHHRALCPGFVGVATGIRPYARCQGPSAITLIDGACTPVIGSLLIARGAPVISPSHLMAMHQHGWQDRGWQDLGTDGRIVSVPKLFLLGPSAPGGHTPAQYLREIAVSCRQYCANPAYSADYPRYYPVP